MTPAANTDGVAMKRAVICSVSGGKDSTATLLLALERGESPIAVFCDTGHEHPATIEYVAELARWTGVPIRTIRADFAPAFARKRETIATKWRADGVPENRVLRALEILHPTGNPFLDLCMVKGRFPSSQVRFCTDELKVRPMREQVVGPLLDDGVDRVESWVGVRADESLARRDLPELEPEFGDRGTGEGLWIYRPILRWTAKDVFTYIATKGAPLNPLYTQGMGRVGCMPCIMARKAELREISRRFPEEIDRVAEWERLVSETSKRGSSTFFPAVTDATVDGQAAEISHTTHGIRSVVEWSDTARGGRQMLLGIDDSAACSSIYGLCE